MEDQYEKGRSVRNENDHFERGRISSKGKRSVLKGKAQF